MDYLSAQEAAEKWGVSLRWVHRLCEDGRIEGVRRFGRNWMIPKGAERPADRRVKSGKYIGAQSKRKGGGHETDNTKE